MISTSGSTGRPKAVAVPHRAVVRLVCNTDYVQLGPADRVAQASNSSFDAATFEVWGALLNGARLIGIPREVALSPPDLVAWLRVHEMSVMFLTTALFNEVARAAPEAFRTLRCLLFGGEAVEPRWVDAVLRRGPPARLLHVYGPTESTTFASWHEVRVVEPRATVVPIGRPIANTRIYVLGPGLEAVPVGVVGELYLGGDGLARGYLNQPGLTAERFVPDPFGAGAGGRLYRTGDLVRFRGDGTLEFLSRVDRQVKIRGFRVEPAEAEAALLGCPGVRAGAVEPRPDPNGGVRLVAYVTGSGPTPLHPAELRRQLRRRLPEYLVPAEFVILRELPMTTSGKVDRRALAAAVPVAIPGVAVASRTETEKRVAAIWADVLGREPSSPHDDFFDLGGHSISALQVVSRLRSAFRANLAVRALFESPTVAELALRIESAQNMADPLPSISPEPEIKSLARETRRVPRSFLGLSP